MKLEDIRTTQRVTECGSDALLYVAAGVDQLPPKTITGAEFIEAAVDALPTNDDLRTAAIVIEPDSTELTVAETDGDVVVTSGDKRRMIVVVPSGDYEGTILFVAMDTLHNGYPQWIDTTYGELILRSSTVSPAMPVWSFSHVDGITNVDAEADHAADWPNDVDPWVAIGESLLDAPTSVTASPASAAQAIAAINAAPLGITAANATGNDGSGALAAVTVQTFAPQADGTETVTLNPTGDDNNITLTAPSAVPANGLWVENGVVKINA
jgi:hypothetical protein